MIVTTAAFPFISSFHRPRLRPCHRHRRGVLLLVRSAAASPSSSSWEEREEARWLREEQRWLREEQRWLREESRWRAEREALLSEITALHLRLRKLEPLPDTATAPVPPPPPAPKPKPAPGIAPPPPPLAPAARVPPPPPKPAARVPPPPPKPAARVPPPPAPVVEVRKEVVVVEDKAKAKPKAGSSSGKRRALRTGSEGEEVRAMQEALEKLGFYSGEEDTEFSSFSTGTERAVKTWQASIGTTEDGLMTSELLERLFTGNIGEDIKKVGLNGALVPSAPETAEIQPPVVKEDFNKHRVYLLGENRWEDPSRLTNRNKPVSGATTASTTKQCITCRGEGRLLCLECDGTGEPNIEPQFLEWVGEDTKCPYCEGLGYTICDACEGSKTVKS